MKASMFAHTIYDCPIIIHINSSLLKEVTMNDKGKSDYYRT